jgi:hypothetical protein
MRLLTRVQKSLKRKRRKWKKSEAKRASLKATRPSRIAANALLLSHSRRNQQAARFAVVLIVKNTLSAFRLAFWDLGTKLFAQNAFRYSNSRFFFFLKKNPHKLSGYSKGNPKIDRQSIGIC